MRAWRTASGEVRLNRAIPDAAPLALPCGGCLGCRQARAKEWTLRCTMEQQQHDKTAFATLTYSEEKQPDFGTLQPDHLSDFIKRFRERIRKEELRRKAARPLGIRWFGSGEYGETTARPHYHAILFGANAKQHATLIEETWGLGHTRVEPVTPARTAYCAGYTSKKIGFKMQPQRRVDAETGELLHEWHPPFIRMSRNPGIGGDARTYTQSWRAYAILNGQHMPVPKYYHEAWKRTATAQMLEELEYERQQRRATKSPTTPETLRASEAIAKKQQELIGAGRRL